MPEKSNEHIGQDKSRDPNWSDVIEMIDTIGFNPDPKKRAQQYKGLSGNDIVAMTTLIHNILAPNVDQNPTDKASYVIGNDTNGKKIQHDLMEPEDRFRFFEFVASGIRKLGENVADGEEGAYLERVGDALALATVLSHPFEDGNGRTARALSELVKFGHQPGKPLDDDFMLMARNRPEPSDGGIRLVSFVPVDSTNVFPAGVINGILSQDIPLREENAYAEHVREVIQTPYPMPIKKT
ncbi:MAG: hypothetical protein ACXWLH_06215 [Candidatus Saccharimonadales bacterium]